MYGHVRQMLWIAVSMVLVIGALILSLQGIEISEGATRELGISHANIKENVQSTLTPPLGKLDEYSGAQVLFMWQNESPSGVQFEVNGLLLPPAVEVIDSEDSSILHFLDIRATYEAKYIRNDQGSFSRMIFSSSQGESG